MPKQLSAIEAEVKVHAVRNQLDPNRAAEVGLRGVWVEQLWNRLCETLVATESDPAVLERVSSARLTFGPNRSFAAMTLSSDGRYTVIVNLGVVEGIAECAHIIAGAVEDPTISGASDAKVATEMAGLRLAKVLGWLTSVAGFPITTSDSDLPQGGRDWARGVTVGAVLFVLAHELGHVISGEIVQAVRDREFYADAIALDLVRRVSAQATSDSEKSAGLSTREIALPTDLTVPAGAMFLSFEGLRQRATASAAFDPRAEEPSDIFEATATRTHPSPYDRLIQLRSVAREEDLDGSEVESVDAIVRGFDRILPEIHRNMPEWVLDAAEMKKWLVDIGETAIGVTPGTAWTFDGLYRAAVIEILRKASHRGRIEDSELAALTELAARMPRTVINSLAFARTGALIPDSDRDSRGIALIGSDIAERIEPLILRYAVASDVSSIARTSIPRSI